MRVIPIETGALVARYLNGVVVAVLRLYLHKDVVPGGLRRNIKSVIVDIGGLVSRQIPKSKMYRVPRMNTKQRRGIVAVIHSRSKLEVPYLILLFRDGELHVKLATTTAHLRR
jgi:hypothetical protein